MPCINPVPSYANPPFRGLRFAGSKGDGYAVEINWYKATASLDYTLAYNVYYSTIREDLFDEGIKFVVTNPAQTSTNVIGLIPGDVYYFAVRATQFESELFDPTTLKDDPNSYQIYPETVLLQDMTDTDMEIFVDPDDIELFPAIGFVQIGIEIIYYTGLDLVDGKLLVETRGVYNTEARSHTTDGYDGYDTWEPIVKFWKGFEEDNTSVYLEENKFENQYAFTTVDGYKEVLRDILTTDLAGSDASNTGFPAFDYSGYRRTDPVDLLAGRCVGSYFGGEHNCADGYLGVGNQVRGVAVSDQNTQREEVLLSITGEPVVLFRRMWTGKRCKCFTSTRESVDSRCPVCFGTGFVTGYDQYFNPRRSDGRIMVRFGPSVDDLEPTDSGLESTLKPDCWTLVVPAVKDRDFIIRFNEDGTEEFRYEILNVTRNRTILTESGAQKFGAQRIRKTDIIYQVAGIRNTATMPQTLTTGIGFIRGPNGTSIPHTHTFVINENIVSASQINQTTSISQGHNHTIKNGVMIDSFGHTHDIII